MFGLAAGLPAGQRLTDLRRMLQEIHDAGFTHCELSAPSLSVRINGELHPKRIELLRSVLTSVPLQYTLHGTEVASARGGNLVDVTDPLQELTVESDVRLAAAIGASVLVYHSGMLRDAYGTPEAIERGKAAERDSLRRLGTLGDALGVRIAVENRDPVGRYIERQVYGMSLERLAEQIERVDHPNVGICFDTGHAFLAACWLDFDYLDGVRRIAPLVNHIHLSDNVGKPFLELRGDPGENLIQGLGDLHLPPGWGAVPFDGIAEIPFPRQPIAIVEMRSAFGDHLEEVAAAAKRFASAIA